MLRDVKHHVTDKNLGFATATGDGRHHKIGVSPMVSDAPIVVTGAIATATAPPPWHSPRFDTSLYSLGL